MLPLECRRLTVKEIWCMVKIFFGGGGEGWMGGGVDGEGLAVKDA